jgi:hypothetical protein
MGLQLFESVKNDLNPFIDILINGKEGVDYVVCCECQRKMKQVQYRHLECKHQMTLLEYTTKYPGAQMIAENYKNTKASGKNPMDKKECREKIKESLKGKNVGFGSVGHKLQHDESSKDLMRGNKNPAKRIDVREKIKKAIRESYNTNPDLRNQRSKLLSVVVRSESYAKAMYDCGLWTLPELKDKKRLYVETVRNLSNEEYQKYFEEIKDAKKRSRKSHLDHIISIEYGFNNFIPPEIISHYKNLRVIPHAINESKGPKNDASLPVLIGEIIESEHPLDERILLMCGGAFGHLAHPFEELKMTFGEVKEMVSNILSGKIEAFEKIDGQQISFSWKGGRLVGARNKSQLKEFGKNSLTADKMKEFFAQSANVPQSVVNAFYLAMVDLEKALSKIPESILKNMFQEGKRFMNTEIVAEETTNVIPYYKDYLVFHGLIEYDVMGSPIKQIDGSGKALEDAVSEVGQTNQSKFQIKGPNKLILKNFKDLPHERNEFLEELKKIQSGLPDTATIEQGQESWWHKFILMAAKKLEYDIPENVVNMLSARWGKLEKAVNTLPKISSQIDNEQFKKWMIDYDKNYHEKQYKENTLPYELFFLKLGAEVLFNASGFLTASPIQTISDLAKSIQRDSLKIKNSKDINDLKRLKVELERLEKIGKNKIVGSEGAVFSQNGKLFKLTGVFQPVHKIISILKFRKPTEEPDKPVIKKEYAMPSIFDLDAPKSPIDLPNQQRVDESQSSLNLVDVSANPIDGTTKTTAIKEGGNAVYSNSVLENKNLSATIKNALNIWGLSKLHYEMVGSIHKSLMNDIDVAIDSHELANLVGSKPSDNLWLKAESYFKSHKPKDIPSPSYKINKGLEQIHVSAPIIGQEGKFIQIDLMLGDVGFMKDALSGAVNSKYNAAYRNLLLANILRFSHEPTNDPNITKKYQFHWKKGLQAVDLTTHNGKIEKGNIHTIYNKMDDVASFLFGQGVTFSDINTFEKLFKLLDSSSFRYKAKKNDIINGFNDDLIKMKLSPIEKE